MSVHVTLGHNDDDHSSSTQYSSILLLSLGVDLVLARRDMSSSSEDCGQLSRHFSALVR